MSNKKKENSKEKLLLVFDVFFVMILCFAVLFATMALQNIGGGVSDAGYNISIPSLTTVGSVLVFYLVFIYTKSKSELKKIVEISYKSKEQQ